jgi:AraC-like DNA-binding protein
MVRPKVFDGYALHEALRPQLGQPRQKPVGLSAEAGGELLQRLEALMHSEKLYKAESIRLDTLAQRLEVPRNTLSQVINQTGMNFFEYINHWRIEEAKKILAETTKKELNVIEVAYEVGFNNKVTFNKSFKKSTGLTPTEFRRAVTEGG